MLYQLQAVSMLQSREFKARAESKEGLCCLWVSMNFPAWGQQSQKAWGRHSSTGLGLPSAS